MKIKTFIFDAKPGLFWQKCCLCKIMGLVRLIFLQRFGLLLLMFSSTNKLPWMRYISSLICLPIISSSYIIHPKNERASSQDARTSQMKQAASKLLTKVIFIFTVANYYSIMLLIVFAM